MTSKLYVVATPIGNLEDITYRAVSVLKEVDIIYAEDTRVTKNLLAKYEIDKPLYSYHQHSLLGKREEILNFLLQGKNIALVTDAGTPGISDPGNELLDYIAEHSAFSSSLPRGVAIGDQPEAQHAESLRASNIQMIPIPGPSSLTAALSICGFNVNKFLFLGFLPKKKRKKLLCWARDGEVAIAFFDNPKRLSKTLLELGDYFGQDRRVLVARELTKVHETLYRGPLEQVALDFKNDKSGLKGEVVVVIEN